MRRVIGKAQQILSVLLAAAMVVTCIPQTSLSVLAAEMPDTVESTDMVDNREDVEDEALDNMGDVADETSDNTEDAETGSNAGTADNTQDPEDETEAGEDNTQDPEAGTGTETPDSQDNTDSETPDGEDDAEPEQPEEELLPEEGAVPAEGMILDGASQKMIQATWTGDCKVILADGSTSQPYTPDPAKEQEYHFTVKVPQYRQLNFVRVYYNGDQYDSLEPLGEADGEGYYSYAIPVEKIVKASSNLIEIKANAFQPTYSIAAEYTENLVDFEFTSGVGEGSKVWWGNEVRFTAAVNADKEDTYGITRVSRAYEDGTEEECSLSEDGSYYTIPIPQEVRGNLTIKVDVEELPIYKVEFQAHDHVTKVKEITVNGKTPLQSELGGTGSWKMEARAKQKVTFQLETEPFYVVTKVTDSDGNILPSENGVYAIEAVTKDMQYFIETEQLSLEEYYALRFDLGAGCDTDSVEITTALTEGTDKDNPPVTGPKKPGDTIVTKNNKWAVTVKATEDYNLTEVRLGDEGTGDILTPVSETAEENHYEVSLEAGTIKTLTIITKAKFVGENGKTITFDNQSRNLTYTAVKAGTKAAAASKTNKNQFTIPKGTVELRFNVVATGAYKPIVQYGAGENPPEIEHSSKTISGKKTTYSYVIRAYKLADAETIVITDTPQGQTLKLDYNQDEVKISINGKYDTKADKAYAFPQHTVVVVKAEALPHSQLDSMQGQVVGAAKPVSAKNPKQTAEITLTLTEDAAVTITSHSIYEANPLKEQTAEEKEEDLTPVKGVYNVNYGSTYIATASYSSQNKPVEFTSVEVLLGKKLLEAGEEIKIDTDNSKKVIITPRDNLAGKKVTVNLYTQEKGRKIPAAVYTLNVSKAITKIAIAKTASQTMDTKKSYKVTLTPNAGTDYNKFIDIKISDEDKKIIGAEFEKNLLYITTAQVSITQNATITLLAKEGCYTGVRPEASITVTVKPLIDGNTAKPGVTLKTADDVSLTLALTGKVDTPADAEGKVCYKVETTPLRYNEAEHKGKLKDKVDTQYFDKVKGTQTARIIVGEKNTQGTGAKCDYRVTVSLVYVKDKNIAITQGNIDDNIREGAESKKFETTAAKPFSTKTPAYETGLKLKKTAATVYTGQKIKIAVAQFSKDTTYTTIRAEDITAGSREDGLLHDTNRLNLTWDMEGNITAEATSSWTNRLGSDEKYWSSATTALGKHRIKVTAETLKDGTMYASSATMDVTVVRGIERLGISVPDRIYKAAKKAASLKAVPVYNEGGTVPKTKKVTWEIVGPDYKTVEEGTTSELVKSKMVTINKSNGTVTVNKNYILPEDESERQFSIRVIAADIKRTESIPVSWCSDLITITNEEEDMQRLAIVKYGPQRNQNANWQWDECWEIVKLQEEGKDLTVERLEILKLGNDEISVVALKKAGADLKVGDCYWATDVQDCYYKDDVVIPSGNLSFKSSSAKNLSIDQNGIITANNPVKNVKITVTANDGSKKKLEWKINVGYDNQEELALKIDHFSGTYAADTSSGSAGGSSYEVGDGNYAPVYNPNATDPLAPFYTYTKSPLFLVTVMGRIADSESPYQEEKSTAKRFNYTLSVKGGKKIEVLNKIYIVATAKETVITLTDKDHKDAKNKAIVHTYKLTTDMFDTKKLSKPPKVTVKGSFYETAKESEQKVTLALDKKALATLQSQYTEKQLWARVELDWTGMSAKNGDDLTKLGNQMFNDRNGGREFELTTAAPDITINALNPRDNRPEDERDKELELAMTPGNYKLKIVVGIQEGEGENKQFTALTTAAAATVKVNKNKTLTFKPATSYTIATRDGGALLSGKPNVKEEEYQVIFTDWQNANIKGQPNAFRKYFEIVTEDGVQKIRLQENVSPTDIGKNDLTGYLTYEAKPTVGYHNGIVTGTVKITVRLNVNAAVAKYTVEKEGKTFKTVTINNLPGYVTAPIQATANNIPIKVKAAAVNTTKPNGWEVEVDSDGKLILKTTNALAVANATVNLWVVPENSYYVYTTNENNKITDWSDDKIKRYGAKMAVTVKAEKATKEQAKTAILNAPAVKAITITNADADTVKPPKGDSPYNLKTAEILQAAKNVVGMGKKGCYTVVVDENNPLKITPATGSAAITLIVKDGAKDTAGVPVQLTYTISSPTE